MGWGYFNDHGSFGTVIIVQGEPILQLDGDAPGNPEMHSSFRRSKSYGILGLAILLWTEYEYYHIIKTSSIKI